MAESSRWALEAHRDSFASKEAELRQRNEDVDRRRAEALRLAGDVVRNQEVLLLQVCLANRTAAVWFMSA